MPRSYNVFGESMIRVKFPFSGTIQTFGVFPSVSDLGLTSEPIKITLRPRHFDVKVDDFGPEVPAEVLANLFDAKIDMTLVHYDPFILGLCFREAIAGPRILNTESVIGAAGTPLGAAVGFPNLRNKYVRLNIVSALGALPWRFFSAYIDGNPLEIPLGTERSLLRVGWRAIPYVIPAPVYRAGQGTFNVGEILSANAVVYDHLTDL